MKESANGIKANRMQMQTQLEWLHGRRGLPPSRLVANGQPSGRRKAEVLSHGSHAASRNTMAREECTPSSSHLTWAEAEEEMVRLSSGANAEYAIDGLSSICRNTEHSFEIQEC